MPGTVSDLTKVLPYILIHVFLSEGKVIKTYDGIHRCPYLMAHIGKEYGLCPIGLLRSLQRIHKGFILHHGFTHLFINVGKSHTYGMDHVIVPVLHMPYTGNADHFIILLPFPSCEVTVRCHRLIDQLFPYIFGLYEFNEFFPVILIHTMVGIPLETFKIGEMNTFHRLLMVFRVSSVADSVIIIKIDMVNTPVFGRKRSYHLVLLVPFIGYVGDKCVKQPSIRIGTNVVAIIVHPPYEAVFSPDPVFHMVRFIFTFIKLFDDRGIYHIIIIGIHHALKGIAGHPPEVLKVFTAEYLKHSLIGIQNLFRTVSLVDKKAARKMLAYLLQYFQSLFFMFEVFSQHNSILLIA